ncbi:DNA-binding FadR family transcriptional regulator [Mesorhizobium sp. J18]|uniref:FadR/GntR family transcriptional regulator n=1 Tax=Mesorhizobium sp. J18 TaxID=935263 RepID=UPI001199CA07|nr:FadR/GntR family transcriptional regulator [Mesorhizobium sp. J18]TWG92056.1 DNA-binding FadR family transcriptional regulator [Mesorhizobium sp. J18]
MKVRSAAQISPIVVPKASDILASQLRQMIVQGDLRPGSLLPSERDLVAESGLSRTSVRDALRVLESEGFVTTKVGRSGGSVVTLPGRDVVARSVELFVRTHGIRLDSLLECRVAVEPTLARLAARHRTPQELENIVDLHEQFVASVGDVQRYKRINLEWHLAIARCSRNEPLIALMEAITMPIRDAMDYQHVTTPEMRDAAVKAHTVILKAIREQDEQGASRRMERHVTAYRDVATGVAANGSPREPKPPLRA